MLHRVLLCALLASCSASLPRLEHDPLPALFPVHSAYPQQLPGFTLEQDQLAEDPYLGRSLRFSASQDADLQLRAYIYLSGAFVDAQEALVFSAAQMRSELERAFAAGVYRQDGPISPLSGLTPTSRGLRFSYQDAGVQYEGQLRVYFVDPFTVKVRVSCRAGCNASQQQMIAQFSQQFVAGVVPSKSVLCGSSVVTLPVPSGLSRVSSNGRVIFLSSETDNYDPQTLAELQMLAARQRESQGCAPDDVDYQQVLQQMRKRARTRR